MLAVVLPPDRAFRGLARAPHVPDLGIFGALFARPALAIAGPRWLDIGASLEPMKPEKQVPHPQALASRRPILARRPSGPVGLRCDTSNPDITPALETLNA